MSAPKATPQKTAAKADPTLSGDMRKVAAWMEKAKPEVFPKVVAGEILAGTVKAARFDLVDAEQGSRRLATMATNSDGYPGFALFAPDGSERALAELILGPEGPALG